MSRTYEHLLVETSPEGVCTITLNRPEKYNAVNAQLAEELPRAVTAASEDEAVRVVVITGAGKGFCAGLDLTDPATKQMLQRGLAVSRQTRLDDLQWVGRWALALTRCDKPVIAAINGPAAGGGFGLALAADIRLMSDGASMTAGYARIGLSPDAGVTWFLPRLVGLARATEMIMTARDIRADEAERTGLVSRVFAADEFASAVADYAKQLASGPTLALALTKRLLGMTTETDLTTQLKMELAMIQRGFGSEDNLEAIQAFAEKRKPVFRGR